MYSAIVIDDEKWVVKSLINTIQDQPYFEVTAEFYDGISGLDYICRHEPALAFVDVRLPGMSGLELLQAAAEHGAKTLFIVISGHAEFAYAQKALLYNAVGYCLKPFSKSELHETMQKAYQLMAQTPDKIHDSTESAGLPSDPSFDPKQLFVQNKTVQAMVNYISEHFTQDISIQTLSELCSISPNYAGQLFRQEAGKTFSSYLSDLRMRYALHLLTKTHLAVWLIAQQAGYRDYFYFAKVFKKSTGYTPSEYRKDILGKQSESNSRCETKKEPN